MEICTKFSCKKAQLSMTWDSAGEIGQSLFHITCEKFELSVTGTVLEIQDSHIFPLAAKGSTLQWLGQCWRYRTVTFRGVIVTLRQQSKHFAATLAHDVVPSHKACLQKILRFIRYDAVILEDLNLCCDPALTLKISHPMFAHDTPAHDNAPALMTSQNQVGTEPYSGKCITA